jgi:hypothetical protein
MENDLDSIPTLHVLVTRSEPQTNLQISYQWEVTLKASSAAGDRVLPYRAAGTISLKGVSYDIAYERQLQVHDANNPIWTTLVVGERPTIRKKIEDLVRKAAIELEKSGKPKFEKRLPEL